MEYFLVDVKKLEICCLMSAFICYSKWYWGSHLSETRWM